MSNIININKKLLAKLPAEQAANRLMAIPAHDRLDLLLDLDNADQIVKSMPSQDFYLFVKDLGGESATPLLALAKLDQLNHIIDVECWNRDELQPGKTLSWLEAILVANNQNFLEWLYKVDFELLLLLFKKWLHIEVLPEEVEIAEVDDDFPKETIDGQYYFEVNYPQYTQMIKSTLSFLFETHNSFYRELMNHAQSSVLTTELEELAYQFHVGRLEDNAIPGFDEAITIYKPLGREGLKANKKIPPEEDTSEPSPVFAIMLIEKNNLLTEALALIDSQTVRKHLQHEFTSLANKIIVADALAPDNPENLRMAAAKAAAYVNLTLEEECRGDIEKASRLVSTAFIEDLFRSSQARIGAVVAEINQQMRSGWLSRWPHKLNCLEPQWQEQASLLIAQTPMVLHQADQKAPPTEDIIRTSMDLAKIKYFAEMLKVIEPVFTAMENNIAGQWAELDFALWKKGQLNYLESVTLGTLIMTAAAQNIATGTWQLSPLPLSCWNDIFGQLTADQLTENITIFFKTVLKDEKELAYANSYMEPLLLNYRQEIDGISAGSVPDPQFVPFFLFTED